MSTAAQQSKVGLGLGTIAFCAAHIPLALLMRSFGSLATLHGFATLAVGLWFAASGPRNRMRVAYVGGYIAGAEVLWRMTGAVLFWEYGKYATAIIFIVAMFRSGRMKFQPLPFFYFVLLLPSAALTFMYSDPSSVRDKISFNLSGPLALMISVCFFSQLKASTEQLERLFLMIISPIVGIAAISFYGIRMNSEITFGAGSNVLSSGGFGPNQVSAALGLGALLALLFILLGKSNGRTKAMMFGLMLALAGQSALTLSRGGLYNALGAATLASLFIIKDRRMRVRFLLVSVIVFVVGYYVLLPRLDSLTGGALSTRFQSTAMTGRDRIAMTEFQLWAENPILGVGPGQVKTYAGDVSHTEFTRILAEHGTVGLVGLFLLLYGGWKNLRHARIDKNKAVMAAMMGWSILFMMNAGMRLVAPAFAFGLAFLCISTGMIANRHLIHNARLKRPLITATSDRVKTV